jgi:DNA damage-binding protein 1
MADGHVVTFDVETSNWKLNSRKTTILGTQHANLQPIPRGDGLFNVFATCEHPSLIYGSEGRMVYSAVTAENASCVCPFDSEAYPGAIAIAISDELKIALVDEERTTHVQTLPIGETVRRIAYSPNLKSFGLGTIRRSVVKNREIVRSHFKLADEVVFQELDSFELNEDEIVESVARADLTDGTTEPTERFIVGTAYIDAEEPDAVRGRILIFEVTDDRLLRLLIERQVKGACRALGIMGNKIVAALVKTVSQFPTHARGPRLSKPRL